MKRNNLIKVAAVIAGLSFSSCNLEVEELDSVVQETESGEFGGVAASATLDGLYGNLRGFADQANLYALLEVSSDEFLVPTRGTDWGDNGVWRTLHQHTWDATHPYVLNSWNSLNQSVFIANQIIDSRTQKNAQQEAEARFLRALNMWYILDLYGQVPFREVDEGPDVDPRVLSSQEAFELIKSDLDVAIAELPATGAEPRSGTLRATKAAANFLLAKLMLNKHVYLGGEPNAADMTAVVNAVDAIENDGYALNNGYFQIFDEATANTETIFWTDAAYGNRIWLGLHYNQTSDDNTGGGWNGFSTTAEFYSLFEGDPNVNTPGSGQEERRGFVQTSPDPSVSGSQIGYGMLIGQQYDYDGSPLQDRRGNPLSFTKEYPGLLGNDELTGVRVIKYHPTGGSFNAYYILMRFADAHLMKAEAILRGGTSSETPLDLVNELRQIRNATPLTDVSLANLLDERGRELYGEGWRRNDQIRFGTFASTWDMKDVTDPTRTLFPIPATALTSNPNLAQNPGY